MTKPSKAELSQQAAVYVLPIGFPGMWQAWDDRGSQLVHAAGVLTRMSSLDCGVGACFVLHHHGMDDLIRIRFGNPWSLDVDYAGGMCAELIAPLGRYEGSSGTVVFAEVTEETWMRVWPL